MKTVKRQISETLLEMYIGIGIFTLLCQITIVWFVEERISYSTGLWAGALLAALSAWHMYRTLDRALEPGNPDAGKVMQKASVLRYVAILLVLTVAMVTEFTNPLSMFLGVMGLKVTAYIQPFTHRAIQFFKKK